MKHLPLAGLLVLGGGAFGIAAAFAAENPHHSHAEHAAPARKAPAGTVAMNPVRRARVRHGWGDKTAGGRCGSGDTRPEAREG
ncbi:MAG: hypothetical protein K0Q80_2956 [Microvirga sp.]|jgi:hypothetical protein|nr:hypothetical protein [Microvirga sp.]